MQVHISTNHRQERDWESKSASGQAANPDITIQGEPITMETFNNYQNQHQATQQPSSDFYEEYDEDDDEDSGEVTNTTTTTQSANNYDYHVDQ